VTEGCLHCPLRLSYFSEEPMPPVDSYREGEHFLRYLGSAQASRFDLRCESCAKVVALHDMVALMLCVKCDPDCAVHQLADSHAGDKSWVYVAMCANTSHSPGPCVGAEEVKALNEYFNQDLHDPKKRITVVPCEMRRSVNSCQGLILADVGLTDLY
jgi:hypothetical protein